MQKWLDLLTPSAAAVAILIALAMVVVTIRQGRAIKRLEQRVADDDGAAARISLERLESLQRRAAAPGRFNPATVLATVLGVAVIATAGWYFFLKEDTTSISSTTPGTTTKTGPKKIGEIRTVPDPNPAPLTPSKGAYTILVLNGSGVAGAAGQGVAPIVRSFGYLTAPPDNATGSFATSVVVLLPGKDNVADNIAKDLGIKRLMGPDGIDLTGKIDGIDAVVIVGKDLASKYAP